MLVAKIFTFPKAGVLDPQGSAVKPVISNLGFTSVKDIQTGKYFEVKIDACDVTEARKTVQELCSKVLVNPVVEDYEFEILEA